MGAEIAPAVISLTSLTDICETPKVVFQHFLLRMQCVELSVWKPPSKSAEELGDNEGAAALLEAQHKVASIKLQYSASATFTPNVNLKSLQKRWATKARGPCSVCESSIKVIGSQATSKSGKDAIGLALAHLRLPWHWLLRLQQHPLRLWPYASSCGASCTQ